MTNVFTNVCWHDSCSVINTMLIKRILKFGLIATIASVLTTVQAQVPQPAPKPDKPKKERPEKGKFDKDKKKDTPDADAADWELAQLPRRLVASGGLSHTVIEEELDSKIIDGLRHDDVAKLTDFEDVRFRGGTSEIKNWITLLGVLAETGFEMDLVDYVPCYRSDAGTGTAMGFATWS